MTKQEELFFDIARQNPALKLSKMFGSPCLKTRNRKTSAIFWKDCLVVKLREDHLKDALKLDGAKLFEPMQGRFMKEWVQLPYSHKDKWEELVSLSAKYVTRTKQKIR